MVLRFRKLFKVGSLFKINISKTGCSSTIGGKGLSINTGSHGTFLNTGISGTGISYRTKLFKKGRRIGRKNIQIPINTDITLQKAQENANRNSEAKEKSERYISKLASETRSFSRTTTEHKILIVMIIAVLLIVFGLGSYIFTMNEKLKQRRAERAALENSYKSIKQEDNQEKYNEYKVSNNVKNNNVRLFEYKKKENNSENQDDFNYFNANLHGRKLTEWAEASYTQKLNTCGSVLAYYLRNNQLISEIKHKDLKKYADMIVKDIDQSIEIVGIKKIGHYIIVRVIEEVISANGWLK